LICPAIIEPKKYQIVEYRAEIPPQAQRSLINLSKLINDLTHGITDKYEEPELAKVKEFIIANHPVIVKNLERLLDSKKIAKAKMILDSSTIDVVPSLEEKKEAEDQLRDFLTTFLRKGSNSSSNSSDPENSPKPFAREYNGEALTTTQVQKLHQFVASPSWKKHKKSTKDVKISTMYSSVS
jgi:hypothetical protein